jgi:ankyrin repeat protein
MNFNKLLIYGAIEGRIDIIEHALENGADVATKYSDGWIALHLAVKCEMPIILNRLNNVDYKHHDDWTALHIASRLGNSETVNLLLSNGADVHDNANFSATPLHLAACNGNLETVEILLSNGSYVNSKDFIGRTALHDAVFSNHPKVVEFLLSNGADVYDMNNYGLTALDLADDDSKIVTIIENHIKYLG